MTSTADLATLARTVGRTIESNGEVFHGNSTLHTLLNGEVLCCFIASKAPNSRGSRRGRHERIGFTYRGKEISRARAEALLNGTEA